MNNKTRIKKRRFKKSYWLFVLLFAVLGLLLLLTHRPADYNPTPPVEEQKPNPYLASVLMPALYNGAQRQEPFEITVTEQGINDIIARQKWPVVVSDISFSGVQVIVLPERVAIMAAATAGQANLLLSADLNPVINEQGLLNLNVSNVKIGAVSVTVLARLIAANIYADRLQPSPEDAKRLSVKMTRSVIDSIPFDPVFPVEHKNFRIRRLELQKGRIKARLEPADSPFPPK